MCEKLVYLDGSNSERFSVFLLWFVIVIDMPVVGLRLGRIA
jgi:hypothetical protein